MQNHLVWVTGVAAVALSTFAAPKPSLAPDAARVKEIAAWLPKEPHAPGACITNRAAWDKLAALPEAAQIIRSAEKQMTGPIPDLPDKLYLEFSENGNRTHYQDPYFHRISRLDVLLVAECLENKGRFLPAIDRLVQAICAERSWTMPAHDASLSNFKGTRLTIDLGSSYRGWMLAIVADWLGGRLPQETRALVRKEVYRRIFDVYLAAIHANSVAGNWWIRGESNWNAVCNAGVVGAALALVEKPEDRAEFVAAMELCDPSYLAGFTADGYCSEGMGYWNYGFGHELMMGLTVRAATSGRLDLFKGEKIRKIASYAQEFQFQPGHSPYFADGGGSPDAESMSLMRQIWPDLVPSRFDSIPLLAGDCRMIGLRAFGQNPPARGAAAPGDLPIRTWFDNAQVLISRPEPSLQNTHPFSVAIKGGHNAEQHNHNDVGSYTVMLDELEMMGDPGGEVYTRRTFSRQRYESKMLNSYGHPVPVVAGKLQPEGRRYAAQVLETSFTPEKDTLVLDITKAYPVATLKELRRTLVYERKARAVTITDAVTFTEPGTFSDPIVTYRDLIKGANPGVFQLSDAKHKVKVEIAVDGSPWKLEEERFENPDKPSPLRLAVTLEKPVTKAQVQFRVTAE